MEPKNNITIDANGRDDKNLHMYNDKNSAPQEVT